MSTAVEGMRMLERVEQGTKNAVVLEDGAELIAAEKFQVRMGIGRTSFYKWQKEGRLVQGKHYIRVRGRVWVLWCKQLLLELGDPEPQVKKTIKNMTSPKHVIRRSRGVDLSA